MSDKNIKDTKTNSPLLKGIKEENIIVMKGLYCVFYFILIVLILCNVFFIFKPNIYSIIICNISIGFILCILLFIPVGIHFIFDYINKGVIVYKHTIIKCLGKCCYQSENIAFNKIKKFDIEKYWYFNKKNFNLGYYDINMEFRTLITGQDPTMSEEFSPELNEIPIKLNSFLNEQNV